MELFLSREELEAKRIEESKKFLIEKGYRVKPPPKAIKFKIKNLNELIRFFYNRLSLKHKNLKFEERNVARDRKIMSEFVKSRMEKGINRERALAECAELIDILFRYEEKLNFKYPIRSVGILGQRNLKWVTERIEEYMLKEKIRERINKRKAFDEQLEQRQEIERLEEGLTQEEELERILKEMEEEYGQS